MIRKSYNGLRKLEPIDHIFVVASRTIGRYTPKHIRPLLVTKYQEALSPSQDLLDAWNDGLISEKEYVRTFFTEKGVNSFDPVLTELLELEAKTGKTVVLLCHCGEGKFCHTNLLIRELVAVENRIRITNERS